MSGRKSMEGEKIDRERRGVLNGGNVLDIQDIR